jgi:DNA-binding MarR family transcriptional regulator
LRQFLRFSEVAARSVGLTSQQHQALLSIKGFPDGKVITIGRLAEQLQVAHHTAVELVDRLTFQDLVWREASIVDRRQVHIKLTDRGEEVLEALTSVHRQELRHLSKRLNSLF